MSKSKNTLYCHSCRFWYPFNSNKEVEAFKLGCTNKCPNCGNGLSSQPLLSHYPPMPIVTPPRED
jgi:hypothetical protein